jgi:hypothetical protein
MASNKKFQQSKRGLFYLDVANTASHTVLAVSTVEHNKSNYTDRDYSHAVLARKVQIQAGYPELRNFLAYLDDNAIPNCPINRQDAINAHAIFGRAVSAIKGKTTRRKLKAILAKVANSLSKEILDTYRNVTLCIDLMFVNCIPFFMSISKKIHFITAEALDNCKQASLENALKRIYGVYRKRGFRVNMILADSELECARGTIATDLRCELNVCSEDEHIPNIERCIRTTKGRTRCYYNAGPFDEYPPRMLIEMVFLGLFWLNAFPHKNGISKTLSPRTIVTGLGINYNKHCRIQFGQYVQTHEKPDNTMTPCAIGAIALRPTGNQQGGHYFCSLMSGQQLHHTHWTELPMPAEAKDRVHALAWRVKAHRGLTFTNSDGNDLDVLYPEEADDDDSDYNPDDDGSLDSADASDDEASDASSASSSDDDDDDNYDPNLPALQTGELAGVDTADTSNNNNTPPGVGEATPEEPETVKTPGVGEDDTAGTAGVEDDTGTGNQLNPEATSQDSDYEPATSESDSDVDENEADNMNADATREQTTADNMDADSSEESDDEESDNNDNDNNLRP